MDFMAYLSGLANAMVILGLVISAYVIPRDLLRDLRNRCMCAK